MSNKKAQFLCDDDDIDQVSPALLKKYHENMDKMRKKAEKLEASRLRRLNRVRVRKPKPSASSSPCSSPLPSPSSDQSNLAVPASSRTVLINDFIECLEDLTTYTNEELEGEILPLLSQYKNSLPIPLYSEAIRRIDQSMLPLVVSSPTPVKQRHDREQFMLFDDVDPSDKVKTLKEVYDLVNLRVIGYYLWSIQPYCKVNYYLDDLLKCNADFIDQKDRFMALFKEIQAQTELRVPMDTLKICYDLLAFIRQILLDIAKVTSPAARQLLALEMEQARLLAISTYHSMLAVVSDNNRVYNILRRTRNNIKHNIQCINEYEAFALKKKQFRQLEDDMYLNQFADAKQEAWERESEEANKLQETERLFEYKKRWGNGQYNTKEHEEHRQRYQEVVNKIRDESKKELQNSSRYNLRRYEENYKKIPLNPQSRRCPIEAEYNRNMLKINQQQREEFTKLLNASVSDDAPAAAYVPFVAPEIAQVRSVFPRKRDLKRLRAPGLRETKKLLADQLRKQAEYAKERTRTAQVIAKLKKVDNNATVFIPDVNDSDDELPFVKM